MVAFLNVLIPRAQTSVCFDLLASRSSVSRTAIDTHRL
jgi:hypothetical protein